jgi:CheY-like chemotaxis protein
VSSIDSPNSLVAHRLKTPLAVIAGFAEILQTRDDPATRDEAIAHISRAAKQLTAEIDDLLGIETTMPAGAVTARPPDRDYRARVVVIDDDDFVRRLLRTTLPADAFEIAEASDGAIALALVEIQRPDLVVLDWQMPNLSGEAVLVELKDRFPTMPILVLTVDSDQRANALHLGADAFLTKPFSPLELLRTADTLLTPRQACR